MDKMTLNWIGSAAALLYAVGIIGYAFTGEYVDICWMTSALLVGVATAAIVGQLVYLFTRSNDHHANIGVVVTLVVCAFAFLLTEPEPEDYAQQPPAPAPSAGSGTTVQVPATGASPDVLRQAQQAFVGEELSENLRITSGLNQAIIGSQQIGEGAKPDDIERMIQRVKREEQLLDDFRNYVDTQNERFRRKLLDAGATPEQANQIAIAFAQAQADTNRENERVYAAWREIFDLTKQALAVLRDNPEDWRFDNRKGMTIFNNQETMRSYGSLQDRIQAIIDEIR